MTSALKKFQKVGVILSALVVALLIINVGEASAQLIRPGDNPSAIAGATNEEGSLRNIVITILNFVLSFLGILAVAMIIYGGFLYVSSAGNQEKTDQGKKIVTYAVIGIVIILISFALVNTVLTAALGGAQG